MKASKNCYDLIKESEGLRLYSYPDTGGIWTIGYGHTGNVQQGQTITNERAEELLKEDVACFESCLNNLGLTLNQNQYDAIIDFMFNLGFNKFTSSTLYKKMKVNVNDPAIAKEINRWVYGKDLNGRMIKLLGLVERRKKESDLYFNKNGL